MDFEFDDKKNELLFKTRGITFQMVIESIHEKGVLADFEHPNQTDYPNQRIFVIEFEGYPYCVPYIESQNVIFLKTIFPSRKFKKLLTVEKNDKG